MSEDSTPSLKELYKRGERRLHVRRPPLAAMDADDPSGRKKALVSALVSARRTDASIELHGVGRAVEYGDRSVRLELDGDERERLESLLDDYGVFKVDGPATRKADTGVVHLSAVTDAKHAADFLEAVFREVFGAAEGYELRIDGAET